MSANTEITSNSNPENTTENSSFRLTASDGAEVDPDMSSHTDTSSRRFRFNAAADLSLLQATAALKPFGKPRHLIAESWQNIASMINTGNSLPVKGRACRDRVQLLLSFYTSKDVRGLKNSGTEDTFAEKEILCERIIQSVDTAREMTSSEKKVKVQELPDEPSSVPQAQAQVLNNSDNDENNNTNNHNNHNNIALDGNSEKHWSAAKENGEEDQLKRKRRREYEQEDYFKERLELARKEFEMRQLDRIKNEERYEKQNMIFLRILQSLEAICDKLG